MLDALARSIAVTAADVLGQRAMRIGGAIPDEAIGLYLWHERGFREHDTLVAVINHTRAILDTCRPIASAARTRRARPRRLKAREAAAAGQLCLELESR